MKANRKFLNGDDEAVSPVIAVILMVAITVVLAATVYVWVSGFGSQSNSPQKSLALASAGSISNPATGDYWKNYTVTAASADLTYGDLLIVVGGEAFSLDTSSVECAPASFALSQGAYLACGGATERADTDYVKAGDTLAFRFAADPTDDKVVVSDKGSNAVMYNVAIR